MRRCITWPEMWTQAGSCAGGLRFDEVGNVVMVADRYQNQIATANDEKDAELQPGSTFKVMSDGADADAGVLVGSAKAFLQASDSGLHSRLLRRG